MSGSQAESCVHAPPLFQHALRVRKVGRSGAHAGAVVVDDIARPAGRGARGRKARSADVLTGVVEASSAAKVVRERRSGWRRVEPTHGALASNASCSERRVGLASDRNTILRVQSRSGKHPRGLAAAALLRNSSGRGAAVTRSVPEGVHESLQGPPAQVCCSKAPNYGHAARDTADDTHGLCAKYVGAGKSISVSS